MKCQTKFTRQKNLLSVLILILLAGAVPFGFSQAMTARFAEPALDAATPAPTPPPATQKGLILTGIWESNIGLTYQLTQAGGEFVWTVVGIDQIGKGTILAQELSATWTGTGGPGAAKGIVTQFAPDGAALRIEWDNGMIFTRQNGGAMPKLSKATPTPESTPTPEPTPEMPAQPTPSPESTPQQEPTPQAGNNLEAVVGPLTASETVRVRVNVRTGIFPIPVTLPNPVSIQLARFYVHLIRDRLGGNTTLDETRRVLNIGTSTTILPMQDGRALLRTNMQEALNRIADGHSAKGSDALANWYVQWAQWFDSLGIDFGAAVFKPADPQSWALSQPPGVLKGAIRNRLDKTVDKLSAPPIQLP